MVSPVARREAVGWLQARGTRLRHACRVIGLNTATWRYELRTRALNATILARLQAHAAPRARFEYRRLDAARCDDYSNVRRVSAYCLDAPFFAALLAVRSL